jgi:hypothetical protein
METLEAKYQEAYAKIDKLILDRDRKRDEGIAREEAARVAKVLE